MKHLPRFEVHLCLVSDQAAANFLPITDKDFRPKEVILMISEKMRLSGKPEYLEKSLRLLNIKVTKRYFNDPFENIEEFNNELVDILTEYDGKNMALNLTGGSKLMAMMAQTISNSISDNPIFYFENGCIYLLEKGTVRKEKLNCKINLKAYLMAYGSEVLDAENLVLDKKFRDANSYMIKNATKLQKFMSELNWHSAQCGKDDYESDLRPKDFNDKEFLDFLRYLDSQDIIFFNEKCIDFINAKNRKFIAGGWLEYCAFSLVKRLKSKDIGIQDIFYNCKLKGLNAAITDGVSSESDVLFMKDNITYIIECKTGINVDKTALSDLYKLENRRKLGGVKTKVCFISLYPIGKAATDHAKANDIELIQSNQLTSLESNLKTWIEQK